MTSKLNLNSLELPGIPNQKSSLCCEQFILSRYIRGGIESDDTTKSRDGQGPQKLYLETPITSKAMFRRKILTLTVGDGVKKGAGPSWVFFSGFLDIGSKDMTLLVSMTLHSLDGKE